MNTGQKLDNDLGTVNISEEVISIMAGLTAIECYGLVGMASQGIQDGISRLLGRENLNKGIEVHKVEDGIVVELYIIVEYGTKISEVASNVMNRVRYTLEDLAGINVVAVNINVQGVRVDNVN
ncbi:Asp23/Gls24 family envelope stress response protein [Halanaerobacter jeridensis]|uniref:Alkaline shock family protein YloU n=1 Tax=Halanaerobacter jeridensis TaxID=706427 RepID=A0A938XS20_9FIRM|nr:Asp23/Gls24 family envelope stress response protein [Halanaerobacter jeridensis]MBM7556435.1 putative alkaline shock family protein YloU [Halanaerobacter jeridensis]